MLMSAERSMMLNEGEFVVMPRGVEHRPVAECEVEVMLFEPAGTLNTGNVRDEKTVLAPGVYCGLTSTSVGTIADAARLEAYATRRERTRV